MDRNFKLVFYIWDIDNKKELDPPGHLQIVMTFREDEFNKIDAKDTLSDAAEEQAVTLDRVGRKMWARDIVDASLIVVASRVKDDIMTVLQEDWNGRTTAEISPASSDS